MNKTEKLARQIFSEQDLEELQQAVAQAEKKTSGEIKLDFEYDVQQDALLHATRIFHTLGLSSTAERNATLIVLFLKDRKFAILGDEGIHKRVPPYFWDSVRARMEKQFRSGNFKQGLLEGIDELAQKLAAFFPRTRDDRNEISDEITFDR